MKSKFSQYSQVQIEMSGREIAERMLSENGITDVKVMSTGGRLTDHYNQSDKTVNLSEVVYSERNVAALAVSAHECGHVILHAKSYVFFKMRSKLVPMVGLASRMMGPIMMISVMGAAFLGNPMILGLVVVAQGITTLFAFVTLSVEFDVSMRALAWNNEKWANGVDGAGPS